MIAVFKRQLYKDNESGKTELRDSKCQQLDKYDNKKGKVLDKFKDKNEKKNIRYVLFLFVTPLSLPQKELNCRTDMNKGIKSLNHLVYIPKIG